MSDPHDFSVRDPHLRHKALERYADNLVKGVEAARSALLAANLIVLLLVGSLFNSWFSWNYSQQVRRAELLQLANKIGGGKMSLDEAKKPEAAEVRKAPSWFGKVTDTDYERELSYLQRLDWADGLKFAAEQELSAHIRRGESQDKLHLPFVSTEFAATDRTIVGGLALILIGAWLLGAISRQRTIIENFVQRIGAKYIAKPEYTDDEHLYVIQAFNISVAFSGRFESPRALRAVGMALWTLPLISIAICVLYYLVVSYDLGMLSLGRVLVELIMLFLVAAIWVGALLQDNAANQAASNWSSAVIEHKAKSAVQSQS